MLTLENELGSAPRQLMKCILEIDDAISMAEFPVSTTSESFVDVETLVLKIPLG